MARRRKYSVGVIGTTTLEIQTPVESLCMNGRCNVIAVGEPMLGGLARYVVQGIRYLDPTAPLTVGTLVGIDDCDTIHSLFSAVGQVARDHFCYVPKTKTRQSYILENPDDHRMIVRLTRGTSFSSALNCNHARRILGLVPQCDAVAIGNLPSEFTARILDLAQSTNTYSVLVPGSQQYSRLTELQPDTMVMNLEEARSFVGVPFANSDSVFAGLQQAITVNHTTIVTDGSNTIRVAEGGFQSQFPVTPLAVDSQRKAVGPGDVFVGVFCLLRSWLGASVTGDALKRSVAFCSDVASAHVAGTPDLIDSVRNQYRKMRPRAKRYIQKSQGLGYSTEAA